MKISLKDYPQHKTSVINLIDEILIVHSDLFEDELKAFNLLAAELFSSSIKIDENLFITDRAYDQGIDFYTKVDSNYEIFQCKFAKFETIVNKDSPIGFDQKGVKELENAYKYLMSDSVQSTANNEVIRLRAQYIAESRPSISFNLCVFGELTEDANQKFNKLKAEYENENIKFNLYNWEGILNQILLQNQFPRKFKFKFKIYDNQILSSKDYCYFISQAKDFYDVFKQYGWALFDLNVRAELKNSNINKDIISSLTHDKTMKNFYHLNNGILIFCDLFKKIDTSKYVTLKNFQVINGCQTVLSIYRACNEISNDMEKIRNFDKNCLVQVKVIVKNKNTQSLIDKIIISTNNQNPMSKRNLKSNTPEQKKIKSLFDSMTNKWFYQRKDGEFDSYRKLPIVGNFKFRISDYTKDSTYRYIDNNELAKAWISFIGFSNKAIMNSDYFKKDDLYSDIFNARPAEKLWNDFSDEEVEFKRKNDYFEIGITPTAEEYLLSLLIWYFIKYYSVSSRDNKNLALERGVQEGILNKNLEGMITNSQEEQAKYLIGDEEYMINNIINSSKEVLVEMYSFILLKKYGSGYKIAKKILGSETIKPLLEKPDFKSYINVVVREPKTILYSIYEFLKFVLSQLYMEIKLDYTAAPRRKAYLSNISFITKFKKKILEVNNDNSFKGFLKPWKMPDKSFIDSIPEL